MNLDQMQAAVSEASRTLQNAALRAEVEHWKNNHETEVRRMRQMQKAVA